MPKEIRAILFTADEVRGVVEHFLQKGSAGPKQAVERVEIEIVKGALHGRVLTRGSNAQPALLGPQDMMTAVLMYCRLLKIPLSSRALKQLEHASNGLMLTMSLNQEPSAPRVNGSAIEYTAPLPTALTDTVASARK